MRWRPEVDRQHVFGESLHREAARRFSSQDSINVMTGCRIIASNAKV